MQIVISVITTAMRHAARKYMSIHGRGVSIRREGNARSDRHERNLPICELRQGVSQYL